MKNAVLKIWYTANGRSAAYEQGKIYQDNKGKWIFLADMTDAKLWHNYNGYSISKQITEAFSKSKIRPRICFRVKQSGLMYETTLSVITGSKSIFVPYGSHEQWILPLKNWKVIKAITDEPKDLPVVEVANWLKPEIKFREDGTFEYV